MPRTRCTPTVRFAELVDRLEAVGLTVGVERHDRRHAITIVDPDSCRAIRIPVEGDFDRAATVLVLSGRLREMLGVTQPCGSWMRPPRAYVSGRWPELLSCWPELEAHVGHGRGPDE